VGDHKHTLAGGYRGIDDLGADDGLAGTGRRNHDDPTLAGGDDLTDIA
jgi:hypothetical protein